MRGLITVLVAGLTAAATYAQSTGSISGTITDPNGAVIAGAAIKAIFEPLKQEFRTVSTDSGLYVLPDLPPGPYSLSVEQTGFKKDVETGIEVRVGLRETIDIKLSVGDVHQIVEVKTEVPLLETTGPVRGQNLSPQLMETLPTWSGSLRLANAFLGYMPGVNSNGETSINGSTGRGSEVMIDGASLVNPESGGVVFYFPGFDAYQEFKLITSNFNAEYGRVGGGIQEYVSKSGTNAIHASAFLNLRRDILDADSWAANANPANPPGFRPKERYNEEGGSAGGPVYLPHIYDGRNRTFFYFTYQTLVQPASYVVNGGETLPTTPMTQGNFSQVSTIYDPTTGTAGGTARTPFPGNQIPQSRWSKVSTAILPFIPTPTAAGVTGNYSFNSTTALTDYVFTIKADHQITTNDRIAFFMTYRNQLSNTAQYLPGPLSNGLSSYNKPDVFRANHDYIIKPTMVLHTTWGFSQDRGIWSNPLQNGFGSKIGLPLSGKADATPIVTFETDALQQWGMNQGKVNDGGQWNWTTMVTQQLSWIRGKHEFKMGWDIRRMRTIGNDWSGTNGSYNFSRAQTALQTSLTTTGNAFASFLLGAVDSASATAQPINIVQIRYGYHSGFWQDTWRVTPRFTLDYGIRYEVPIGWHVVTGNYASLDPTLPDPTAGNLPGALIFMGNGAGRTGQSRPYPTDFSDFGPRGGFAYRVSDHTVVRGGFGGQFSQSSNGVDPAFNWDGGGVKPPATFKAPPFLIPGYDNFSNAGIYELGPNYGKAPRTYNWSLTVQHDYKGWLFEGAYVGNRAHGLNSTVYLNQLPTSYLSVGSLLTQSITSSAATTAGYSQPFSGFATGWGGGATVAQSLRPFPQYGAVFSGNAGAGKLWYDSFQGKIEHRFGNLNLMASYVWSKTLDVMTYRQIFSQGAQVQTQDSYNINDGKSFAPYDFPHFVNILTSYRLPFGKGQRFGNSFSRPVNFLISGWTIATTQQYRSGSLIEIVTPGNPLGSTIFAPITKAVSTGLPIRTGVAATSLDPNNPNSRWFNYGANSPFAVAPAFSLGNASIYNNAFRNPWFRNENMSLARNFTFMERAQLRLQADFYNIFNRTDFGGINGTVGNVNFGRPTGAQDGARAVTLEMRATF